MLLAARRREWVFAFAALGAVTIGLLAARASVDNTHIALAYLLVVLGVSSHGGRALGIAVSTAAFLCFNFFFVPPYYTLTVAQPLDWAVLGAFLLTSLVASQLLVRAGNAAASAELRAREVERLSALGAETLNAARAEDSLGAIAEMIRATLDAALCDVHVSHPGMRAPELVARAGAPAAPRTVRAMGQPSEEDILAWVATNGRLAVELEDGSMRVGGQPHALDVSGVHSPDVRALLVPLHVRGRTVGVLTITPARGLNLDPASQRFLEALSYYAALGVERVRLAKDADRADALQKADEVKNAVLASVSHDLRTPLTTIKALAHEIRQSGDDRAATIEEEADRLNRFVADLLDLSRLAGGALQVTPEINAAEDLVGVAMQRVSGAVGDKHLVASLDPSEPLLLGRFDFVHSLRVLGNLIDNAIKFAPPNSGIEVHATRNNGALEFVVADRGLGVPASDREAIFQPFHRRAENPPEASGVGLGLSIARGLAEAQSGSVRYEDRLGGGSRFVFSVPAADFSDLGKPPKESL
jgi:two-component system sensor histidine kinase KdpD